MWWIIAGGVVLLYLAASHSRTRKQRIVQAALSDAVLKNLAGLYALDYGDTGRPITPAEVEAMAKTYFHSLLELFGARDFATLMRAMTIRQAESWDIEKQVLDRLVAMVPGTAGNPIASGTEYARLRGALTNAGELATIAGRNSGEV